MFRALTVFISAVFGASSAIASAVIDVDTGVPIKDVWMVATRSICIGIGHCNTFCTEVRAVKANDTSKLPIPWWRSPSSYEISFYHPDFFNVTANISHPEMSRKGASYSQTGLDDVSA